MSGGISVSRECVVHRHFQKSVATKPLPPMEHIKTKGDRI